MGGDASVRKIIFGYLLFFSVLFSVFFSGKLYLFESAETRKFHSESGLSYPAKTEGKRFLVFDDRKGWSDMFIAGVNLGAAKPGSYPGEFAITKAEYLRYFKHISDMHANTIRVYTAHMPVFYEALAEFNSTAKDPIYLIQGVYLNEEDIARNMDAFGGGGVIKNGFLADIRNIVDIIHGMAVIEKKPGLAGGTYTADVSPYVIGWILGIEWDPDFVINTNLNNAEKTSFEGTYVKTQNASPFEVFLAEAAETAIAYETGNYREQRPVALCNWVTTDPLAHPGEPYPTEDAVGVDVEHILKKSGFEAGFFASYHVYPYYPDLFSYEAKYLADGKRDTYSAYLKELNAHHTMPLFIAEVGIPASRGIAHENKVSGFNQGHANETTQGEMIASLVGKIRGGGLMGALIFSWSDEWFKTTWNTMDLDLLSRRAYWLDVMTNEQNFGLLAYDPGKTKPAAVVDGSNAEWRESDLVAQSKDAGTKLYVRSDEAYLYIMAKAGDFATNPVFIPIDTISGQGNTTFNGISLGAGADFLVVIHGVNKSTVLVDPYYDVTYYAYAVMNKLLPRDISREASQTGNFVPITQVLSRALVLPETGQTIPFSTFDAGKLRHGNADPNAANYDSLADFCFGEGFVEIRLPYLLLNVMDPSGKKIIGNMYANNGIMAKDLDSIVIGIVAGGAKSAVMGAYNWKAWEEPNYHERLKESYYIVKDYFASFAQNVAQRTAFEVFWAKWNETTFSRIATWFPIQPVLNYMIAFLLSVIAYFFFVLVYIHTEDAIRQRSKSRIKAKILLAIKALPADATQPLSLPVKQRKLLSRNGLIILNELFELGDGPTRQALSVMLHNAKTERLIGRKLNVRKAEDLVLIIRLVGALNLKSLAGKVALILYSRRKNVDLQYQSFMTLSTMGCYEQLVSICRDKGFVHILSFRSLQEVLKAYGGDKAALYRALMQSPDRFIVRICIKRIGLESHVGFAGDVLPYLEADDYNTVIDAARTLGQLRHAPAAPKLIGLLAHDRWEVRSIAATALGAIDAARYADRIESALHDGVWQVRYNAAKALCDVPDIDAILLRVEASGDRYAYEILRYTIHDFQLREVRA
jgi:hypothetical protein